MEEKKFTKLNIIVEAIFKGGKTMTIIYIKGSILFSCSEECEILYIVLQCQTS